MNQFSSLSFRYGCVPPSASPPPPPAFCGEGAVNAPAEECDLGSANVTVESSYGIGLCTAECKLASFCSHGSVQEESDATVDPGGTGTARPSSFGSLLVLAGE